MEPLDGELALASHWVVKSKAEMLKEPFQLIASVIGFGVLGTGIGIPAMLLADEMGVLGRQQGFSGFGVLVAFLWVFGILGTALGGYVGNRITEVPIRFSDGNRSKDK